MLKISGAIASICSIDNTWVTVKAGCGKLCSIRKRMDRMSNVFSVRGNVSSARGKGDSAETGKTEKEHYTLLSLVVLPS